VGWRLWPIPRLIKAYSRSASVGVSGSEKGVDGALAMLGGEAFIVLWQGLGNNRRQCETTARRTGNRLDRRPLCERPRGLGQAPGAHTEQCGQTRRSANIPVGNASRGELQQTAKAGRGASIEWAFFT
jgi:hypothetical protein